MNLVQAGLLFLAAVVGGAINSVAGGGSFVSFPTLLFLGIPPVNANATNTVALWPGQVASIGAYRAELKKLPWRSVTPLLITGIVGGILGAWVLLKTPQKTFMSLVPWLMLIATLIFMFSGKITQWVRRRTAEHHSTEFATGRGIFIQIFIAFYIGYFGAGAGILILAMLALLGMDQIHTMNALKALLTTVSNGVAMLVFVVSHALRNYWPEAILMIIGSILGGYFGAHFAQKTKPENVRRIVIAIGLVLAAYFFAKQITG
ncbi:MAG: sulfite exporter TauE/SafE family protein [Candidatus Korobacteraceae bacterium]